MKLNYKSVLTGLFKDFRDAHNENMKDIANDMKEVNTRVTVTKKDTESTVKKVETKASNAVVIAKGVEDKAQEAITYSNQAKETADEAHSTASSVQGQLNSIVVDKGKSDIEVVQLRTDKDGVTSATAKERIDKEQAKIDELSTITKSAFSTSHGMILAETLGTNIHELQWAADFPLMNSYGVKIARDAIVWSIVEKQKGVYNFNNNGEMNYDQMVQKFTTNNIRPHLMLLYTNGLYNDHMALDNEESKQAFANWAGVTAARYKNKNIIWEIYNEPNGEWFWTPQDENTPIHYADVVKRSSVLIKQNDPTAFVVAPAIAELEEWSLLWMESMFKEGVLDYIDAVSVHPYRTEEPESVIEMYRKLRSLISRYTKRDIPIVSSEWGYSNVSNWDGLGARYIVENELQQAQYTTRMLLINHSQNLPISIVYDWKDDGEDATTVEHHFGLLNYDQVTPKKSGTSYKVLRNTLGNYQFVERIDIGKENDYLFKYMNNQLQTAYAFWTTDEDHTFILKDTVNGTLTTMLGTQTTLTGTNLNLTISNSPSYLVMDIQKPLVFETPQKAIEKMEQAKMDVMQWSRSLGIESSPVLDFIHIDDVTHNGSYRATDLTSGNPSGSTFGIVDITGNKFDERLQKYTDIEAEVMKYRIARKGESTESIYGPWHTLVREKDIQNAKILDNVNLNTLIKDTTFRVTPLTSNRPTGISYGTGVSFGTAFGEVTQLVCDITTNKIVYRSITQNGTSTWDSLVRLKDIQAFTWESPILKNGVTKHPTEPVEYGKNVINQVTGQGAVVVPTSGSMSLVAFTLPVGYRPSKTFYKSRKDDEYKIEPNGNVTILNVSSAGYFLFDFMFQAGN